MWLLARLRLLRLLNLLHSSASQAAQLGKSRAASPGKRRGWALGVVLALVMCYGFGVLARDSVFNVYCALDPASVCHLDPGARTDAGAMALAAADLAGAPFAPPLAQAFTLQLWLLFLISVLVPLSTQGLARPDDELEWLVTLPLARATLLWGRLFERGLVSPSGWLALAPACLMLAWYSGQRWSAAPLAALGVCALLMLAALLRTLADTGLRLLLAPSQLRNLQALCSIASLAPIYLAASLGNFSGAAPGIALAAAFPAWTGWTPPGLVLQLLNAHGAGAALAAAAPLALEVAALLWLGVRLLRHLLRDGVLASGPRERASGPRAGARTPAPGCAPRWRIGTAVQRRELSLLGRDRNFLVQSLLLPVLMVLAQLYIGGRLDSVARLGENPAALAALAFAIGAYMLLAAFHSVDREGAALWLLYTFPVPIETVLKQKAQLWALLTAAYPLAVFGLGLYFSAVPDWELLGLLLLVLAGMPIYALIAVALGALASNPLAQQAQARSRPTYFYLYTLLAALYGGAIAATAWPQKIVCVGLTAALALALWQKARDALPYLLDPDAAPPMRVSGADGLIAAFLFFLLQAALLTMFSADGEPVRSAGVTTIFAVSGAFSYALMRYSFWRTKAQGVPKVFGRGLAAALAWGLGLGAGAAVFGCAGVFVLRHAGVLAHAAAPQNRAWLLVLGVLAAPLFEEFIFRGLVFGGLRRSMRLAPAMLASAAIFAIVHPPQSMLPVFALGLCSAYAYERGKTLLAPMLVHACYNGAVFGYQMFF